MNVESVYMVVFLVVYNYLMSFLGIFGIFYVGGKVVLVIGGSLDEVFVFIEKEKVIIIVFVFLLVMIWFDVVFFCNIDLLSLEVI